MSRAWYMDDDRSVDQREPHHLQPPKFIDFDEVNAKTGVIRFKLNPDTFESDGSYARLREERGYNYEDVNEPSTNPDYENMIKRFYVEHMHTDEEIRYVERGSGYFDVRDRDDRWIRIEAKAGDLIILPAGIYHRFTLDNKNYIRTRRLFIGQPVWTPHNRPCDEMKERKGYVRWMSNDFKGDNVPVA